MQILFNQMHADLSFFLFVQALKKIGASQLQI